MGESGRSPDPDLDPKEPASGLTTPEMIIGIWTGTVNEVGVAPYTINLTFRPGAFGEVTYSGYDCRGLLSLATETPELTFRETISVGRDICADGTVKISLTGPEMSWIWINERNEIQATATLTRAN